MKEQSLPRRQGNLVSHPEEIVYRSCYASVNLSTMLQDSELRSAIRKLPPAQLYFSLKELEENEISALLPHVTEEQWTTILDLDLWRKDEMNSDRFIAWQRHILFAEDAVARKILRATDLEAWALTLKRNLRFFQRGEDGEFSEEALAFGQYETPDRHFMVVLPRNAEKARILHQLLQRLYETDIAVATRLINSCLSQTSVELEEGAYQNRRRRIEDMGFQDYFDAIEIYSIRTDNEQLPVKQDPLEESSALPTHFVRKRVSGPLILFQALAAVGKEEQTQKLIEELFYVCNKLLSADRISPDQPSQVKKSILKAISCLNLGLDCWSGGDLGRAVEGISKHYLLSFFQIGFGRLTQLKEEARRRCETQEPIPGSFLEAVLEALTLQFPELAEQFEGKIRTRFFQTEEDLGWGRKLIEQLSAKGDYRKR